MPKPDYISETETSWAGQSGATKTTPSISVTNGDLIVGALLGESNYNVHCPLTLSGGSLTWTSQQASAAGDPGNNAYARGYTAPVTSTGSITVTATKLSGGANFLFGANIILFRNHGGVGASSLSRSTGAPTVNITTTQANSAIVVIVGDWNAVAGGSRTWRTNAGTLTELTYDHNASTHTFYIGVHQDAGAVGTYAVGLSAPSGQNYDIIAVEVKGTVAAGGPTTFRRPKHSRYRMRHSQPEFVAQNGLYLPKRELFLPLGRAA